MKDLIIIGKGGHGKSVEWIAKQTSKWKNIFFLDEEKKDSNVLGTFADRGKFKENDFFVGIGNNQTRKRIQETLVNEGFSIATIVSIDSNVTNAKLGVGTIIMNQCLVNVDSTIGDGAIINNNAVIDHDCKIGDYTHVSPSVNVGGTCTIGLECWLGIGSTIINNIIVSNQTIIGAGATVISDITELGTYVGVPAKKI